MFRKAYSLVFIILVLGCVGERRERPEAATTTLKTIPGMVPTTTTPPPVDYGSCVQRGEKCCLGDRHCTDASEFTCPDNMKVVVLECNMSAGCVPIADCRPKDPEAHIKKAEKERPTEKTPPEDARPGEYVHNPEYVREHFLKDGTDCPYDEPREMLAADIVVDHTNPNIIYVTVWPRGVFKTMDGGKTWKESNNGILAYKDMNNPGKRCYNWIGKMVIDPTNPKRILLSPTDVSPGAIDDPYGAPNGVWETTDGGKSWRQLVKPGMNSGGDGALAIDPNNPKTIYFGTGYYAATYLGADPDKIFNDVGVLYKTTDGGENWVELPTGHLPGLLAIAAFVDKEDSDNLILLTNAHTHGEEDGVHLEIPGPKQFGPMKSTDGGRTWTALADKLPKDYRMVFWGDVSANNFDHMYVRPDAWKLDSKVRMKQKSFYSTDGGKTFSETSHFIYFGAYDPHDREGNHMIGFSPLNGKDQILESWNAGKTWKPITKPAIVDGYNYAVTGFAWDPIDPDTIYMTGSGAHVWKSINGGKSWKTILDHEMLPEPESGKTSVKTTALGCAGVEY
jgi:photosystem II stability/assembly factor-like uncharacterized protein